MPSDYQRFSSPPVGQPQPQSQFPSMNANGRPSQDYQRFSSPPVTNAQVNQAPISMFQAATNIQGSTSGSSGTGKQQQQMFGVGNMQSQGPHQQYPNMQNGQMPWGQFGMMNDATAQMGMQFGRSAVAAGQEYMNKNVSILQMCH